MDGKRTLAEGLVVFGSVAIMIGTIGSFFPGTPLLGKMLLILLGIGLVALGGLLRYREVSGSGVKDLKWPRWLVSVFALLILLSCSLPLIRNDIRSQEIVAFSMGFCFPPALIMILGACGLFSATFLISLWVVTLSLFSLDGSGAVGLLRLALAATMCIASAAMCLRGIIRALRESSSTEAISS